MWRSRKEHHAALQVALAAGLAALLLLGPGDGEAADAGSRSVDVLAQQLAGAESASAREVGRRGDAGQRGPRGPRGPVGPPGPEGIAAGAERQFISINWQDNQYAGRDRQTFVAPGIGRGEVQCIPPYSPDGDGNDGRMRIQFFHDDGVKELPRKWATTMWVTRFGGNADDGNRADRSIVKTNRIASSDDNRNSFSESMDSAPIGEHDPESIGAFEGIITTEPFNSTMQRQPPPTTFSLSWYWNFRDAGSARCYVSGTFVTAPR